MSMEQQAVEKLTPQEVKELFGEILKTYPILNTDPYSKRVFETGIADNGEPVLDFHVFAEARAAWLEKQDAEVRLAASKAKNKKSYDAAIISSERPDMEIKD